MRKTLPNRVIMTGYVHSIYNVKINKIFSNMFASHTAVNDQYYVLWISNIIYLIKESNSGNVFNSPPKSLSMTTDRLLSFNFKFVCPHKTVRKINY